MQKVILDLLPGGVAPIVYASQYDDGCSIRFMLTEGGPDSQYSLNASDVITCNLTKPDGTETVINVANPGAGKTYVDLVNGADDYDQAGAYLGEIVLTKDARVIGSANFVLKVEEDAYGGQITTLTATGNPCTFSTDLADALVSLTADIVCGGGNGTPSSPIPIVGHSELNLTRCGKNFWNVGIREGYIYNGRYYQSSNYWCTETNIAIFPNTTYTLQGASASDGQICFYDENNVYIPNSVIAARIGTFTTPNNAYFISVYNSVSSLNEPKQLELGSTATAYEPYNGNTFTIAFGQTVYGGVLDVTRGKLTVTSAYLALNGSENWTDYAAYNGFQLVMSDMKSGSFMDGKANYLQTLAAHGHGIRFGANNNLIYCEEIITDMAEVSDLATWKTYLSTHNLEIVYPLATPFDIELTPVQIEQLLGKNNVWHDANGDTEVKYLEVVRN